MFVFFFNWLGFSSKKRSLLQQNKHQESSQQLFQVFILEQILTPSGSLVDIDGDGIPDTVTDGLVSDIDLLDNAVTDLPEKDHFVSPEVFTLVNDTVHDETITLNWIDGDDLENLSVSDSLIETSFEFETSRNTEITVDNPSFNGQVAPIQEPMTGEHTTEIVSGDNVAELEDLRTDSNLNQEVQLLSFIDAHQTPEDTPEIEANSHFVSTYESLDIASEDISKILAIDELSTANEDWKITHQSVDSHSSKEIGLEIDAHSTTNSNLIGDSASSELLDINGNHTVIQDSETTAHQSVDSYNSQETASITESSSTIANDVVGDHDGATEIALTNNSNFSPLIKSGYFIVEETGKVIVDFQFDGGKYQFELAIFSLDGMEDLEPGSQDFIREAAYRALSNSNLGHVVISDAIQGAQFSGILGTSDLEDYNTGAYKAPLAVSMRPGDTFGFMLVPNGTTQQVFENPNADGALRPLFSLSTANPNEVSHTAQLADVFGDGTTFVMEDLRVDTGSDRDYNDVIFRVEGAKGYTTKLDDVIAPGNEWRYSELGQRILTYVSEYDNPDKEVPGNPTYPGLPTPEIPIPTVSPTLVDQGGNGSSDLTGVSNPTAEPNQGGALHNTPTLIETSATVDLIDQVSSTDATDFYQVSSTQLVDTEISVLSGNTSVSILTTEGELLSQQILERGSHSLTLPENISGEVLLKFENQGGSDATYMLRGFESQAKEPFNIDVEFGEGLSASQKEVIQAAAKSIESLIGQGLPSAIVDGKIIDDVNFKISVANLDDSGGTLAQTKIDFMRYGTLLPAQSLTQFDVSDITQLESSGQLFSVVQHEILHGLGFGNLWEAKGFVDYAGTDFAQYTGENAVTAFQELGGATDFISLETEGKGSADLHWNEMLFQDELMTRDLGFQTEEDGKLFSPISTVTLAALADLGYQVNRNRATPNWGLLGAPPLKEEDISEETRQALEQLIAESKAQNPGSDIPIIIPAVDPNTISPEIWAHAERFDLNGEYYEWKLEKIGDWKDGYTLSQLVYDRMTNHPSKDPRSRIAKALDPKYWQFIIDRNAAGNIILDPDLIYKDKEYWLPVWHPNYEAEQEAERKRREEELNKKLEEEKKERERLEEIYRQKGSGGLEWYLAKPFPDFGDKAPFETSVRDVVGSLVPDDYFRFTLSRPGYVTIYLEDLLADADLYLYDSRNRLIGKAERSGVTDEKIIVNLPPGTYMVRVHSANGLATDYNLKVRFDGLPSHTQVGSGSGSSGGKKPRGATFADPRIERIFKKARDQFAAAEQQKAQTKVNSLEAEKKKYQQDLDALLAQMIREQKDKVYGALDNVRDNARSQVTKKANELQGIVNGIADKAINGINAVFDPFKNIWGIGDSIRNAQDSLKGAVNGAKSWLNSQIDLVNKQINDAIWEFNERVKNAYRTGAEINQSIEDAAKWLKSKTDELVGWLNARIDEFGSKILGPVQWIRSISVVGPSIYSEIEKFVKGVANNVKGSISGVGDFFKNTVDGVKPLAQKAVAAITDAIFGDKTGKLYNQINGVDQQIAATQAAVEKAISNKTSELIGLANALLKLFRTSAEKDLILGALMGEFNSNKTVPQILLGTFLETALSLVNPLAGTIPSIRDLFAYGFKYWGKLEDLQIWKNGNFNGDAAVDLVGITGSIIGLFPLVGPSIKGVFKLLTTKGDDLGRLMAKLPPEVLAVLKTYTGKIDWKEVSKFSQNFFDSQMTGLKEAIDGMFRILDQGDDLLRKMGIPQYTSRISYSGQDFRLFLVNFRDFIDDFSEVASKQIDYTILAVGKFISEFLENPLSVPKLWNDIFKPQESSSSQEPVPQP